jgi:hypothetical protein
VLGIGYSPNSLALHGVGTPHFDAKRQDAVAQAAQALITDYFSVKRKEELVRVVPQADPQLQEIIKALLVVADDYLRLLDNERGAMRSFYIANSAVTAPGLERMQAAAYLHTDERKYEEEIDQREAAAVCYKEALRTIAAKHSALAHALSASRWNDVASIARAYVQEYQPIVARLDKIYGKVASLTGCITSLRQIDASVPADPGA